MSSSAPIAGHMKALLHHIKSVRNEVQKLDKPSAEDLIHYQQHLRTIEHHKHDGVWCGKLSTHLVPNGQAEVQAAFQEAHDLIEKKLQQSETEVVDPAADEELSLISAITLQVNEVLSELKRLQYEGNVNTAAILPVSQTIAHSHSCSSPAGRSLTVRGTDVRPASAIRFCAQCGKLKSEHLCLLRNCPLVHSVLTT